MSNATQTVTLPLALAAAVVLLAAPSAGAQETDTFTWQGRLAAGQTVEIRGVNGDVRAELALGDRIEVVARKQGRRDDPRAVAVEVVPHAGGVVICSVYPTPRGAGRANRCGPDGHSMSTGSNDVEVHYTVRLPAGIALRAHTVTGDIVAEGVRSHVDVRTVSGDVRIATSEAARARTVTGDVRASVGTVGSGERGVELRTVSGDVELVLPANAGARVSIKTVSGGLRSDFPLTVEGRVPPRRLEGVIGGGGPTLTVETVSGEVRLRRGG
jgi:hypothetical protein